ncbi:hypothetical protein TBR22_A44640 [Luteitalea sp. TBR-22]|uniref:hypothetical protein n=1 Tax=Luteitalea sp. TBR-22 TaxID=2802971 RepID=UPI001AF8CD84|nr:hypothetical protein [Luteitalea sp. TBR-22]BCS35237.1 hypothetical protein TBR22_A44640 [Luteitalea sp. TBR-22]
MTRTIASWLGSLSLVAAVLITTPTPALAGPPLICHPFDIGTARSLPFGDTSEGWRGWNATAPSYDRARLVADTLALLTPTTPVIVRMETLRRASAYAAESPALASALLAALEARAPKVARTKAEGLALFDAGYLVETYRQLGDRGVAMKVSLQGKDGYAMVRAAMAQAPDDAALHFAAALMTTAPDKKAAHLQHLAKARQGARADTLLARNLTTHDMAE